MHEPTHSVDYQCRLEHHVGCGNISYAVISHTRAINLEITKTGARDYVHLGC